MTGRAVTVTSPRSAHCPPGEWCSFDTFRAVLQTTAADDGAARWRDVSARGQQYRGVGAKTDAQPDVTKVSVRAACCAVGGG